MPTKLCFEGALAILEITSELANIREGLVASTKVTVFNNGSLRVEGDFEIVDQEGKPFGLGGRTAVTLCRCGRSANQPFCDGTHKRENFTSTVTARDLPPIMRI
jgi:CDGSH-type Zn-finger protein